MQDTEATLQESMRERAALQAGRDTLFRQLQGIAAKISAGQIPEPSELELPPDPAQDAAVPAGRTLHKIGSYVGGLTDEEQEVSFDGDTHAFTQTLQALGHAGVADAGGEWDADGDAGAHQGGAGRDTGRLPQDAARPDPLGGEAGRSGGPHGEPEGRFQRGQHGWRHRADGADGAVPPRPQRRH